MDLLVSTPLSSGALLNNLLISISLIKEFADQYIPNYWKVQLSQQLATHKQPGELTDPICSDPLCCDPLALAVGTPIQKYCRL